MKVQTHTFTSSRGTIHYYELKNDRPPLVLIHAQGVCATSYDGVWGALADKYHVFAVDCFGHGGSSHDKTQYTVQAIGDAILELIQAQVGDKSSISGHSSGGLIAAYLASCGDVCEKLVLEDPPLFSCQGERRKTAYNYLDLSTVCHTYLTEHVQEDFVAYYFEHQKMWEFFPQDAREKIQDKMVGLAKKARAKHPERDLKLPFWPKAGLEAFRGMQWYDPWFGEAFYADTFHGGVPHEALLRKITCPVILMKAETKHSDDGVLQAAMEDGDAQRAQALMGNCQMIKFDCGHGIHIEKKRAFLDCF